MIASMATGPLKLTEWMKRKGVSDAEFARWMGVDRATVGKWRKKQTQLDPFLQARIAGKLGIWPAQLWFLPDSPQDRMLDAMFRDILPNFPTEPPPKPAKQPKKGTRK